MKLPNSYWLKGEEVYKRRDRLRKKYTFVDYAFSRDFIYNFVHWFFVYNIPHRGSLTAGGVRHESIRLLRAIFSKRLRYDKGLDRFCDLIRLDRMAWRLCMYRKAPGKPSSRELEYDVSYRLKPVHKSMRPYGSRWSRRLAGIPAEFGMNEGCFGASKWIRREINSFMYNTCLTPCADILTFRPNTSTVGCVLCDFSPEGCEECLQMRNMTFRQRFDHNNFITGRYCSKCRYTRCNLCYQKQRSAARKITVVCNN